MMITWVTSWPPLTSCPRLWKSENWSNSTIVAEALTSSESYNTTLIVNQQSLHSIPFSSITPTKKCDHSSLFVWWCPALWVWWPGQCQCCDHGTPEADHVTSPWCYPHCDAAAAAVASPVSFSRLLPSEQFEGELWRENHVSSFSIKWLSSLYQTAVRII